MDLESGKSSPLIRNHTFVGMIDRSFLVMAAEGKICTYVLLYPFLVSVFPISVKCIGLGRPPISGPPPKTRLVHRVIMSAHAGNI
jgi:hypothetical protein